MSQIDTQGEATEHAAEPHEGTRSHRFKLEPSWFIPWFAAVVSVLSLIMVTIETKAVRDQVFASVWPRVVIDTRMRTDSLRVTVRNAGVGPAEIISARLERGAVQIGWSDFIVPALEVSSLDGNTASITGSVMTAGTSHTILNLHGQGLPTEDLLDDATISICYCSLFEHCWRYVRGLSSGGIPDQHHERVPSCLRDDGPLI